MLVCFCAASPDVGCRIFVAKWVYNAIGKEKKIPLREAYRHLLLLDGVASKKMYDTEAVVGAQICSGNTFSKKLMKRLEYSLGSTAEMVRGSCLNDLHACSTFLVMLYSCSISMMPR